MNEYLLSQMRRELESLYAIGTVHQVDYNSALARVEIGQNVTGFLPWLVQRAGHNKTWNALEVGEQVVVLDPFCNLNQGVILGSLYQNKHTAPANTPEIETTQYKDGTKISYDRAAHKLEIDIAAAGEIQVTLKSGPVRVNASEVHLIDRNNGNFGVVTGGHVCQYTGLPHSDCSKTVTAEK